MSSLCVSAIIVVSLVMFIPGLIVHRILLKSTQCINSLKSCIKKENDITPDDAEEDLVSLVSDR